MSGCNLWQYSYNTDTRLYSDSDTDSVTDTDTNTDTDRYSDIDTNFENQFHVDRKNLKGERVASLNLLMGKPSLTNALRHPL